eukprot:2964879-Rhodomonas_salina.4
MTWSRMWSSAERRGSCAAMAVNSASVIVDTYLRFEPTRNLVSVPPRRWWSGEEEDDGGGSGDHAMADIVVIDCIITITNTVTVKHKSTVGCCTLAPLTHRCNVQIGIINSPYCGVQVLVQIGIGIWRKSLI